MTSPFSTTERSESLMDMFQLYSRQVVWAGVAVVAVGAGGWFYIRSQDLKSERAEKAYYAAQRSFSSGNLPLAESDLRKMIERYDGTRSAMQARIQLAQILYDQNKFEAGVTELRKAEDKIGKSEEFGASFHLVLAAGLEQLGKFGDAASEYEKAATATKYDADRQRFLSMAAASYLEGGNKDKAKQLWTELGADSKGAVAGEARVRLGELMAATAPKS